MKNQAQASLPTGRRAVALLALAAATVALIAGAWSAQASLLQSRAEHSIAISLTSRLDAARGLLPEVERRERFAVMADGAAAQSQKLGFDPAAWAERRITRAGSPISRSDANALLRQVGGGGSEGLFAADSFELSVLSSDAGLFHAPAFDDKGLTLAMSGVLYFPLTANVTR